MGLWLLAAGCLLAPPLAAAPTAPGELSTFTLIFENDLFGDTDEQYTSGIQIGWQSADLRHYADENRLPRWLLPLAARLPFIHQPGALRNVGFTLGQKIYTPGDTASTALVRDDRPYAGWLFGAVNFTSKTAVRLDSFELQAGVIGPASFAEDAQNLIHDLRDLSKPRGWDHQLENEPGLALVYEHRRRPWRHALPAGWGADFLTHAGGALGNVFTYVNAGGEVRLGWNLPADYGSALIGPGSDTNAPVAAGDPRLLATRHFGVHAFAAITGRAVLRDVFLDGNTFTDSHDVDKIPLVGDLLLGVSMTYRRVKLSYTQAFRTREFEGQRDKHNFGSLSLSVTF